MVAFQKPGKSESYDVMAAKAARTALEDAGLDYDKVQQAYAGYVYGDSTCGQRALYRVGMTGIPVINVNNNCSTGSTALFLARQAVESGAVDCALALGFEQMQPGAIGAVFSDRVSPFATFDEETDNLVGNADIPLALRYFGGAGKAHMDEFGTTLETFAKIRAKASRHAAKNPVALFRQEVTPEDVLQAQVVWPGVMTKLMACPPTCGAAAAIICSKEFADKHGLDSSVRIAAQAMTTDGRETFNAHDMREVVGYSMAKRAADQVYEAAGIGPDDVDVVECTTVSPTTSSLLMRRLVSAAAVRLRSLWMMATTPMAANTSPTRRAVCCPRAIRLGRPALPNAPSLSGSCVVRPRLARSTARAWRFSTIWASAVPV
ncbi:hypothetical protein NTH_04455 (plasmid) [Nitratireductor thuwali]|uniref:Thiolase N-terminal domain-containing protein n=1 Tax=Nitratireductor thuwali TaxID=2267699 RepID=A0ABY5MPT2_9HYPH|nr:hypothetical protein NTH_04455 [Nitratireductor thuwali]